MLSAIRGNASVIVPVVLVLIVLFAGLFYLFGIPYGADRNYSREALRKYPEKIEKNPHDPSLLLKAARHHYHVIREELSEPENYHEDIHGLVVRALQYYRRIIAGENWQLQRKDQFYIAYLYLQLARLKDTGAGSISERYMKQARKYGLKSHEQGFRSPELFALLGNVHYNLASTKDDYQVALQFYESVGEKLTDPVLMLNKIRTLTTLGRYDEARRTLKKLSKFSLPKTLQSEYRVALVELLMAQGKNKEALKTIRDTPEQLMNVTLRILRARSLNRLGQHGKARKELNEIVENNSSNNEARELLNEINRKHGQNGS